MGRITFGIIVGMVFGILDVIPMYFSDHADKAIAMTGAFFDRFAMGFLIPNVSLPFGNIMNGLFVGVLMSLPAAIITGAFVPIMTIGIIGGGIIGFITGKVIK